MVYEKNKRNTGFKMNKKIFILAVIAFIGFHVSCKKENIIIQEPVVEEQTDNLTGRKVKLSVTVTDALSTGLKQGDTIFVSVVMDGKIATREIFANEMATFDNLASGVVDVRILGKGYITTFIQIELADVLDTFTYDTENYRNVSLQAGLLSNVSLAHSGVSGSLMADLDLAQNGLEKMSDYTGSVIFKISQEYFTQKYQDHNACKIVSARLTDMVFVASVQQGDYTVQLPKMADEMSYEIWASDFPALQMQADGSSVARYFVPVTSEVLHFGWVNKKQDIVFDALP